MSDWHDTTDQRAGKTHVLEYPTRGYELRTEFNDRGADEVEVVSTVGARTIYRVLPREAARAQWADMVKRGWRHKK